MDPLFRGRDSDHILCRLVRVRPGALRGRVNESHARKPAAFRLHLQQQMVREHLDHPVSK